jgi:hypothetical protein
MKRLLSLSLACVTPESPDPNPEYFTPGPSVRTVSARLELMQSGQFYPHLPVKRRVRLYDMAGPEPTKYGCTKIYKKGVNLGPGSLFVYCLKCKLCIGFQFLLKSESPGLVCKLFLPDMMNVQFCF